MNTQNLITECPQLANNDLFLSVIQKFLDENTVEYFHIKSLRKGDVVEILLMTDQFISVPSRKGSFDYQIGIVFLDSANNKGSLKFYPLLYNKANKTYYGVENCKWATRFIHKNQNNSHWENRIKELLKSVPTKQQMLEVGTTFKQEYETLLNNALYSFPQMCNLVTDQYQLSAIKRKANNSKLFKGDPNNLFCLLESFYQYWMESCRALSFENIRRANNLSTEVCKVAMNTLTSVKIPYNEYIDEQPNEEEEEKEINGTLVVA